MRRFLQGSLLKALTTGQRRHLVKFEWDSKLPTSSKWQWSTVGREIVDFAITCDTGRVAFLECCVASEQLDFIIQSLGYDMSVYVFGGLTVLNMLEVGGDADFVGISDVEPNYDEAAAIIVRINRELRRMGIRSRCYPKARVPVIKADRTSKQLPGTPFQSVSNDGIFQFARPLNHTESTSFAERALYYGAEKIEWTSSNQIATVHFSSPTALVQALSQINSHDGLDIPLHHPADVGCGPELYRFPFDFCLASTGLRNSHLLGEALSQYKYARHMLLALKKWGRSSGVVNSKDGLLASYALTVLLTHYLIKVGKVERISLSRVNEAAPNIPRIPEYKPLETGDVTDYEEIGLLFAGFFEYYATVFDFNRQVVCTTNLSLTKEAMKWDEPKPFGVPPFFHLAIRDPYGLDNVGRNLDAESSDYVKKCLFKSAAFLLNNLESPTVAVREILYTPPKPAFRTRTLMERGIHSPNIPNDQLEALHVLDNVESQRRKKSLESFGRRAAANSAIQQKASTVTKNMLQWIKTDSS